MKAPPLFVSFYTPTYVAEARGLVESLQRFRLDHDVRAVPDLGSWELNTRHKATFLRLMREEFPRRPLVWLDADAEVVGKGCELFERLEAYDVAYHWFGPQACSGTVFLGPTHESYEFVRRWEWRCKHRPELSDQEAMADEAEAMPGLRVFKLPACMCHMADLTTDDVPPCILHHQASRTLR